LTLKPHFSGTAKYDYTDFEHEQSINDSYDMFSDNGWITDDTSESTDYKAKRFNIGMQLGVRGRLNNTYSLGLSYSRSFTDFSKGMKPLSSFNIMLGYDF